MSFLIFEKTVKWYKSYYEDNQNIITSEDLSNYIKHAKNKNLEWTK